MNGEIVILNVYDVGEFLDLNTVLQSISPESAPLPRENLLGKNTPSDLELPTSFPVKMAQISYPDNPTFPQVTLYCRFFEIGVIALSCYITFYDADWGVIYSQFPQGMPVPDGEPILFNWLDKNFEDIKKQIQPAISDKIFRVHPKYEQYVLLCITDIDVHSSIEDFIEVHRRDIAGFLAMDAHPERLHESQVHDALKTPFTYTNSDYAFFNYDRAVVLDLNQDYLDIIYIAVLANLELLELRTLDLLLDKVLEGAEIDINRIYSPQNLKGGDWDKKVQELAQYRTNLIWLQEEISNASKFIGDFFLGQIFEHITSMYELQRWQDSIKRKMQFIQELYEKARHNREERRMYHLEVFVTVLFIFETIIVVLQYLIPNR